jgi:hypothetical protein
MPLSAALSRTGASFVTFDASPLWGSASVTCSSESKGDTTLGGAMSGLGPGLAALFSSNRRTMVLAAGVWLGLGAGSETPSPIPQSVVQGAGRRTLTAGKHLHG